MRIAMVASEVAPFSKEGGLADVLGALPAALAERGHDVCVISPLYRGVREAAERAGQPLQRTDCERIMVPVGDALVPAVPWATPDGSAEPAGSGVRAYFLENDRYYDRDGYYTKAADHSDFQDNGERFIFLSRGSLELLKILGDAPDVIHSHDWPTGLVPIYLKHLYRADFPETAAAFTVHNIAYQGIFWHWDMNLAGLPWSLFTWQMLEYYGNLCFLKAGLVGADVLTTVSQTYAREIQTEEQGHGLHGVLQERAADLYGIVNGVDGRVWDPANDPHIPAHFTAEDLSGKAECKRVLQERFGLRVRPEVPLIGMICRLVDQKGLDLLAEALPELLERDLQFVLLGTGEPRYHALMTDLHAQRPRSCGVLLDHDEAAAHLIEAGSDMFLMPSRFEPCGLNQLYSLRYGTVPVVRATGGLADTVADYTEAGLDAGTATGFCFSDYSAEALGVAVGRALAVWRDQEKWRRLMLSGMAQDWSWGRSAREYEGVYEAARQKLARAAVV